MIPDGDSQRECFSKSAGCQGPQYCPRLLHSPGMEQETGTLQGGGTASVIPLQLKCCFFRQVMLTKLNTFLSMFTVRPNLPTFCHNTFLMLGYPHVNSEKINSSTNARHPLFSPFISIFFSFLLFIKLYINGIDDS